MYAIIVDGSHQYRVEPGTVVWLQSKANLKEGDRIEFPILLVCEGKEVQVGRPHVEGAKAVGEIVEHARGEKIKVRTYKRRKHVHRTRGHRQEYTAVKITDILTR